VSEAWTEVFGGVVSEAMTTGRVVPSLGSAREPGLLLQEPLSLAVDLNLLFKLRQPPELHTKAQSSFDREGLRLGARLAPASAVRRGQAGRRPLRIRAPAPSERGTGPRDSLWPRCPSRPRSLFRPAGRSRARGSPCRRGVSESTAPGPRRTPPIHSICGLTATPKCHEYTYELRMWPRAPVAAREPRDVSVPRVL
jgi:hypothetical protein